MAVSRQVDDRRVRRAAPRDESAPPETGESRSGMLGAGSLAARAIDLMVSRRHGEARPTERWIVVLRDAVVGSDPGAHREVAAQMLSAGVPAAEICDLYVPAVARCLGDEWSDDTMSFAEVSIGASRLQALLRDVALDPWQDPADDRSQIALMVLADENHTLGAMVLTGQLRRQGASVRLVLDRSQIEMSRLARGGDFDAVLVSVALADDVSAVKRMITMLRELTGSGTLFVVGGGILEIGPERVCENTGADHATSDPRAVLELIGHSCAKRRER
jgi:MerR family transcriptional regulator, light-induced transcriptional regulator